MPTRFLNDVPDSTTSQGITYNYSQSGYGRQYGNPWQVWEASGTPVSNITEPHITIWGDNNGRITTVEFTWSGSYHLEYRLRQRRIYARHMPSSENSIAATLENYLISFLMTTQIVGPNIRIGRAFSRPAQQANNPAPQQQGYKFNSADFPAL